MKSPKLKLIGAAAFAFFLLKGLIWLLVIGLGINAAV